MIWAIFAILTALAVIAVLHPLMRRSDVSAAGASEAEFYRAQLAEIERDLARGVIRPAEAESARAEAGRRLLASADADGKDAAGRVAPERPFAIVLIALIVPFLSIGLYIALGQPDRPDMPLAARMQESQTDLRAAVARLESHLQKNPDDGRGWEVIAPVYLRMGRADDSAKAWGHAIRILGETADRLTSRGEALTYAANGIVTSAARELFEKALTLDADTAQARFYTAVAADQEGDKTRAAAIFRDMLDKAPSAPYAPLLRERLKALGEALPEPPAAAAPSAAESVAALPPAERQAAIRGMVEGLAARLSENGHDLEGWLRLVRAWTVLGEKPKAVAALADARKALAADDKAKSALDALARELGLES